LAEKTAAFDAANPKRNIIGMPEKTDHYMERARTLLRILPKAPYELVADSNETELIKYAGNAFLFFKVLFGNVFYDLAQSLGADYGVVREALGADPRIGPSHLNVVDASGHMDAKPGRGAGGHCLIKDFAALRQLYQEAVPSDQEGLKLLEAFEEKNVELLRHSGKDIDLLEAVYGKPL
jgi:UDPglucose 6-dehydrogenase